MNHDHPKRCVAPKMISGQILLLGVFLELVREDHQLQLTPSGISVVVVVDRWVRESQVVYGMEKWDHEK